MCVSRKRILSPSDEDFAVNPQCAMGRQKPSLQRESDWIDLPMQASLHTEKRLPLGKALEAVKAQSCAGAGLLATLYCG
jgi:hypothetical protein